MTIQEIIQEIIKNAKPMTRMDRAKANWVAIMGTYPPDNLHESWADRA